MLPEKFARQLGACLVGVATFRGRLELRLRSKPRVHVEALGAYWDENDQVIEFCIPLRMHDRSRTVDTGYDATHMQFYTFREGSNGFSLMEVHGVYDLRLIVWDRDFKVELDEAGEAWVEDMLDRVEMLQQCPYRDARESLHLAMSAMEEAIIFILAEDPSADVSAIHRAMSVLTGKE